VYGAGTRTPDVRYWHKADGFFWKSWGFKLSKRKKRRLRGSEVHGHRAFLVYDEVEVVRLLKAAIEREGSQSVFARRHGLDRSHLNQILLRNKPVSVSIAKTIGLRRVYAAE
jgi:hypothetical protein